MAIDETTLHGMLEGDATHPGKVDKVSGKGLSSNDYTNAEKEKLAGIEEAANNYRLPIASKDVVGGVKTLSTVTSATGYTPAPIIGGIPYYKDTVYAPATQARPGLMSAADKKKLDTLSTSGIQPATADALGGVKVGDGLAVANDGTLSAKPMTGATETADGAPGMVPAAGYWQRNYFLRGDGFWVDNHYTLPEAEIDQLGGVRLGDYIRKVNGKITVPVSDGIGAGIIPLNDAPSKVFTGTGWKKLDADNLPLIANDTLGCVKIPVYNQTANQLGGYTLEVVGDNTGKLYARTPHVPVASAATIPGATDVLFGPKDGLMSGADKEKLDAIETGANRYVLPEAGTMEAGGVRVADVEIFQLDPPVASDASEEEIATATEATIAGLVANGQLVQIIRCAQDGLIYAKPLAEYYHDNNFVEMTDAEVDLIVDAGAVGRDAIGTFQLG